MDVDNPQIRTPVRPAQTNLAIDLHLVSNNVNARIFDRAGSMYFVFYNGDYHGETMTVFPPGLNSAHSDQTRDIMQLVARQAPVHNGYSLLFDWLTSVHVARDAPGQDPPRLSDADVQNMDIDS